MWSNLRLSTSLPNMFDISTSVNIWTELFFTLFNLVCSRFHDTMGWDSPSHLTGTWIRLIKIFVTDHHVAVMCTTLSLRSSHNVSDQVSHPYKINGKIVVLYIQYYNYKAIISSKYIHYNYILLYYIYIYICSKYRNIYFLLVYESKWIHCDCTINVTNVTNLYYLYIYTALWCCNFSD